MNVAGGGVALGEEKGLFPVLIDSDVYDEDGVTKKLTFAGVDKDIAGLDFGQCTGLHFAREGEGAGYAIGAGAELLAMHHRCSVGCGR